MKEGLLAALFIIASFAIGFGCDVIMSPRASCVAECEQAYAVISPEQRPRFLGQYNECVKWCFTRP